MSSSSSSEEVSSVELLQARNFLWHFAEDHVKAMALKCAIDLGIPDIIHNHGSESIPLSKLIAALPIHPSKAHCVPRLMRILAHHGFFGTTKKHHQQQEEEDDEEEEYSLNVVSRLLLDESPFIISMKPFVSVILSPKLIAVWGSLSAWFRNSDATLYGTVEGRDFYDFLEHNPESLHLFNDAMSNDSKLIAHAAVKDCKEVFQGLKSLVDVGGGTGSMAKAITNSFPTFIAPCLIFHMLLLIFTDPKKLNFVGGDMFSDPIPPADAILLKWILICWSDEECLVILKRCREALLSRGKGGKVIVIEMMVGSPINMDTEISDLQLAIDIRMMTEAGKNRTFKELEKLFKDAGFSHSKSTLILGERYVIEVYP